MLTLSRTRCCQRVLTKQLAGVVARVAGKHGSQGGGREERYNLAVH
jgi:hypothetical protein